MNFKVFGVLPLTFIFAALQFPLLQKYATAKDESSDYCVLALTGIWRAAWVGCGCATK